ncbi:hypothetical protein B0H16DRAFT_1881962 [Mycena metata]|uniref:Uncharacterized protein n=1 Tax=Mycena metata TaxID=1033252 RepID=A0AAD7JPU9_9AGAR|nr:hypothetical protein B0H16DRAFT_1881962 [Mycena metata]
MSSSVDAQGLQEALTNDEQYTSLIIPTQAQHLTSPLFSSPYLPTGPDESSPRTIFTRDDLLVYGSPPRAYVTHNQVNTGYPYYRDPDRGFPMPPGRPSIYANGDGELEVLVHLAFLAEQNKEKGSLGDAFAAAESQPDFLTTVDAIWAECFPDISVTDAVHGVAATIRTWRSEIGKRALQFLDIFLEKREEEFKEGPAEPPKFVARELNGMSFRGACRFQPVVWTYAYHVRITEVVPEKDRRRQKCALPLTLVSVERAYGMWKPGNKIKERVERRGRKTAHSFVAAPWGVPTRQYLPLINKLSHAKWAAIASRLYLCL